MRSLLLALSILHSVRSKTFVVSPSSNFPPPDVNWTRSTSLAAVLQGVRANDTVYLCNGERFRGPFKITNIPNVSIAAYPCTQDPARPLLTNSVLCPSPPTVSTDGVWSYDVSGLAGVFDPTPAVTAVWVGDNRYHPARFPNRMSAADPTGAKASEFLFRSPTPRDRIQPAPALRNMSDSYWINSTVRIRETDWSYLFRTVAAIANGNQLVLSSNFSGLKSTSGFFIEKNDLRELDAPGEFVFSSADKRIYLRPFPGQATESPMWFLPATSANTNNDSPPGPILSLTSQASVSIEGVSFQYARYAIKGRAASRASDIDVRQMTSLGLDGAFTVVNSTFADIGSVAVTLRGGGSGIYGSVIRRVGLWAGYIYQPSGVACWSQCTVQNNVFDQMGYSAVLYYAPAAFIADNTISNVMLALSDGAAIFCNGQRDGVIVRNVITNIFDNFVSSQGVGLASGIYLDWNAYNSTVANNTVAPNFRLPIAPNQNCIKLTNGSSAVLNNLFLGCNLIVDVNTHPVALRDLTFVANRFLNPMDPVINLFGLWNPGAGLTPRTFTSVAHNAFCKKTAGAWSPLALYQNFTNTSVNAIRAADTLGSCACAPGTVPDAQQRCQFVGGGWAEPWSRFY